MPTEPSVNSVPAGVPVSTVPPNPISVSINQHSYFHPFEKTYSRIDVTTFDQMNKDFKAWKLSYPFNSCGEIRPYATLDNNAKKYFWSQLNLGKQQGTFSIRASALMPENPEELLALEMADFTVLFKEVCKPLDKIDLVRKVHAVFQSSQFPTAKNVSVFWSSSGQAPSRTVVPEFWVNLMEVLKFYHRSILILLESVSEVHIPKLADKEGTYEHLNSVVFKNSESFKGLESLLKMKWGTQFYAWLKGESYGPPANISRRDELPDLISRLLITASRKHKEAVDALPILEQTQAIASMKLPSDTLPRTPFRRQPSNSHSISEQFEDFDFGDDYDEADSEHPDEQSPLVKTPFVSACDDYDINEAIYGISGRQQTDVHPASSFRGGASGGRLFDARASRAQATSTLTGKLKQDLPCFQLLQTGTCNANCLYSHSPMVLYPAAKQIHFNAEYLAYLLGKPSPSAALGEPKARTSRDPSSIKKTILSIPKPQDCVAEEFPFSSPRPTSRSAAIHSIVSQQTPEASTSSASPASRAGVPVLDESSF